MTATTLIVLAALAGAGPAEASPYDKTFQVASSFLATQRDQTAKQFGSCPSVSVLNDLQDQMEALVVRAQSEADLRHCPTFNASDCDEETETEKKLADIYDQYSAMEKDFQEKQKATQAEADKGLCKQKAGGQPPDSGSGSDSGGSSQNPGGSSAQTPPDGGSTPPDGTPPPQTGSTPPSDTPPAKVDCTAPGVTDPSCGWFINDPSKANQELSAAEMAEYLSMSRGDDMAKAPRTKKGDIDPAWLAARNALLADLTARYLNSKAPLPDGAWTIETVTNLTLLQLNTIRAMTDAQRQAFLDSLGPNNSYSANQMRATLAVDFGIGYDTGDSDFRNGLRIKDTSKKPVPKTAADGTPIINDPGKCHLGGGYGDPDYNNYACAGYEPDRPLTMGIANGDPKWIQEGFKSADPAIEAAAAASVANLLLKSQMSDFDKNKAGDLKNFLASLTPSQRQAALAQMGGNYAQLAQGTVPPGDYSAQLQWMKDAGLIDPNRVGTPLWQLDGSRGGDAAAEGRTITRAYTSGPNIGKAMSPEDFAAWRKSQGLPYDLDALKRSVDEAGWMVRADGKIIDANGNVVGTYDPKAQVATADPPADPPVAPAPAAGPAETKTSAAPAKSPPLPPVSDPKLQLSVSWLARAANCVPSLPETCANSKLLDAGRRHWTALHGDDKIKTPADLAPSDRGFVAAVLAGYVQDTAEGMTAWIAAGSGRYGPDARKTYVFFMKQAGASVE